MFRDVRVLSWALPRWLLLGLGVGALATLAWVRAGQDRHAALAREADGLARVLRGAALEARNTLQTAQAELARRLATVARRMDEALTRTREVAADVLQRLAEEEGVGRVCLLGAEGQALERIQTPAPLAGTSGGLLSAEDKHEIEWADARRAATALAPSPGEVRTEGFRPNAFHSLDRFGVAYGRPAGGMLLLRANAEELTALRRRFGLEPLLARLGALPDVTRVLVLDARGDVVLAAGARDAPLGRPAPPPDADERGAGLDVEGDAAGAEDGPAHVEVRLTRATVDAAIADTRRTIALAAAAVLAAAGLAFAALRRLETRQRRREAEGAVRLAEERRLAEMGALAGLFAHEVGNPLNAIGLAVELLPDADGDAHRAALFATLRTELARITRCVEGFLRVGGAPRTGGTAGPDLLGRVAERASGAALERGVHVQVEVAPGAPSARADPLVLEEAVLNLVRNALTASPPGGTVRVAWARDADGGVLVRVTDTGPGFPPDRDGLFRLGTSPCAGGHGLGLPLARRFVQSLGGRLELTDARGGGAAVDVHLRAEALPRA